MCRHTPYQFWPHPKILMADYISQVDDLPPGDVWMLCFDFQREMPGCFTDDFQQPFYRKLCLTIEQEVRKFHIIDILRYQVNCFLNMM